MTEDDIWYERRRELLKMIREAGISTGGHPMNPLKAYPEQFERFAELVAKAEREACAALFDDHKIWDEEAAAIIRARGNV